MPEDAAGTTEPIGESETDGQGRRFAVLDVFGLKLEVSNPRLAELLTMDAKDALASDVRELVPTGDTSPVVAAVPAPVSPDSAAPTAAPTAAPAAARQADSPSGDADVVPTPHAVSPAGAGAPELVLAAPTPRDEHDARLRREFRARVDASGAAVGFRIGQGGIWHSDAGLVIVTRVIERGISLAAASHYVGEIAARREQIAGKDATVLFVVDSQQTADVFKVAIRQRRLYDLMRTISIDNLEDVKDLVRQDVIDHRQAVVLLVPITNIDVGEVLSIIRSTSPED